MVPKPFPYPFGIGIDVCKVPRVASLLQNQSLCNRWARKVFTRLEWPALWNQFQKAQRESTDNAESTSWEDLIMNAGNHARLWKLPDFPEDWLRIRDAAQSEVAYNEPISHEHSPVGLLARHLAGRWAAKEAVIKAHSHRRLYMHDVSIINPRVKSSVFPMGLKKKSKTIALVDPEVNTILIDERTADTRALRGFGPQSWGFQKGALLVGPELNMIISSNEIGGEAVTGAKIDIGNQKYFQRRAKIEESDRQIAEVNISHDGDTAVAVCLAFDKPESQGEKVSIIDDGRSLPMHEPQWGDMGWFSEGGITERMPELDKRIL